MNEEQLRAILEMSGSDIGGMEDEQLRQIALAQAMRGSAGSIRGNDVGANIGRAAYGISGAMGDYKAKEARPEIGAAKKKTFADIIRGMGSRRTPANPTEPVVPRELEDWE